MSSCHRLVLGAAISCWCLFSSVAGAAPLDMVRLRGGGYVRGQVVEHDPAKGTTVVLVDGTSKRYAPEEVESVKLAEEDRPAAASAPLPSSPPVILERESNPEGSRSGGGDDDAEERNAPRPFAAHLRTGLAMNLGSMVVGTSYGSSAVAFSFGIAGRLGIQYHEKGALYYEPSATLAVDSGPLVFMTWQQIMAEWTPGHFLLAGGAGIAPMCVAGSYGGCVAGNFGTTLRLGYHSGHEDRSAASSGVFVGGEARTAILPNGAVIVSSLVVGWELL